jgi:hypothetical protein
MIHIILSLGIIMGGILFSIAFKLFQTPGMQASDIFRLQQFAYASYIPAFIIAFIVVREISLKSRLPEKIPAHIMLIMGVWITIFKILMAASVTVKMAIGYFMGMFPFAAEFEVFIHSSYVSSIAHALILYGLFVVLLAARPTELSNKD